MEFEKAAVSILKKPSSSSGTTGLEGTFSTNNISERMAKRRKRDEETSSYIDCNFILGSIAEVERVFSFAKYLLSDTRRCMTPQLFEALMFLKINSRFWDAALVEKAIGEAGKERASARYMAHRVWDDDTDKEE